MEQRHVEIPPKRLYNDHTDKMDEMSMLTLCKLVINHYGWTRGMVKYPQNASGMAIWAKNKDFGQKKKFRLLGKNKNCSKSVKNGSPRAGMHRFVTDFFPHLTMCMPARGDLKHEVFWRKT